MRLAILTCLLAISLRANAAFDVFLRITPANASPTAGESTDPIYSGWSTVLGFEAATKREIPVGGNTGRTSFLPFTLVKTVDKATPLFFDNLTRVAVVASVKMVVVSRTPARVEFWDISCQQCLFTKQTFTAAAGGDLLERISFDVGQFEWSYTLVSGAGDPIAEYFANWDILTNRGNAGVRTPTNLGDLDSDGDGIPDGWEAFYGLRSDFADSALDTDGDGLDNLHEFIAHTNPRVTQSTLRVTAIRPAGSNVLMLTWSSVTGLTYRVESAPSPAGPFTLVKTVPSSGNSVTSTTVPAVQGALFYRIATP